MPESSQVECPSHLRPDMIRHMLLEKSPKVCTHTRVQRHARIDSDGHSQGIHALIIDTFIKSLLVCVIVILCMPRAILRA
jgi:hypothetical protein